MSAISGRSEGLWNRRQICDKPAMPIKPRVRMQNPNRTGLRTESGPGKGNPNRIRPRGRANRTESGSWMLKPNRIRFLGPRNEPNSNFGFGTESESEPRQTRDICRYILVLTAITIVSHLRAGPVTHCCVSVLAAYI